MSFDDLTQERCFQLSRTPLFWIARPCNTRSGIEFALGQIGSTPIGPSSAGWRPMMRSRPLAGDTAACPGQEHRRATRSQWPRTQQAHKLIWRTAAKRDFETFEPVRCVFEVLGERQEARQRRINKRSQHCGDRSHPTRATCDGLDRSGAGRRIVRYAEFPALDRLLVHERLRFGTANAHSYSGHISQRSPKAHRPRGRREYGARGLARWQSAAPRTPIGVAGGAKQAPSSSHPIAARYLRPRCSKAFFSRTYSGGRKTHRLRCATICCR